MLFFLNKTTKNNSKAFSEAVKLRASYVFSVEGAEQQKEA